MAESQHRKLPVLRYVKRSRSRKARRQTSCTTSSTSPRSRHCGLSLKCTSTISRRRYCSNTLERALSSPAFAFSRSENVEEAVSMSNRGRSASVNRRGRVQVHHTKSHVWLLEPLPLLNLAVRPVVCGVVGEE